MFRSHPIIPLIISSLLLFSILGGLVWANTQYSQNHPGGRDFLVQWLGARTLLQYGNNPYDDPATQRAQIVYYGRLANAGEDPLHLFVPFPIELFFIPFALTSNYGLARGFWMTLLEAALAAMGYLSLRLTVWKPSRILLTVILIFSILWVYDFIPLISDQSIIFVGLSITGLLLAIREERDELAGALMLLPLFSPEIAGVFVLFILWWTIYHRRWRILGGSLMTVVILLAIGFFLLPGWFEPFVKGWISHLNFNPGLTPGIILGSWWPVLGQRLGWVLTAFMLLILFLEWRAVRKKNFRHFLWTACITLAATPFLGIPVSPKDYVVLFLPLTLFLVILGERWSHHMKWGLTYLVLVLIFVGSWFLSGYLWLRSSSSSSIVVFTLLLPGFVMIGLYWMRWWAIRPPRTWSDPVQ
jgi:hypothetical protein